MLQVREHSGAEGSGVIDSANNGRSSSSIQMTEVIEVRSEVEMLSIVSAEVTLVNDERYLRSCPLAFITDSVFPPTMTR